MITFVNLCAAVLLVLAIGCRPKEGAYIVFEKALKRPDLYVKHMKHTYQAFMPAKENKTKHPYDWLIPQEFDEVVKQIYSIRETGFSSYSALHKSLDNFYRD